MRFVRYIPAALIAFALGFGLAPADAQSVKIGSILSVTGPAAFLGEDMKAGMELAIEEINAKGGVLGKKIDWVFYDAESQTQKGLTATRRLIDQDKVDMIVGGGNMSGMAIAMLGTHREGRHCRSCRPKARWTIVTPVAERQWTFKSTADDDQVMERLADYFAKKNIKKVALARRLERLRPERGRAAEEGGAQARPRRDLRDLQPVRHRHDAAARQDQGRQRRRPSSAGPSRRPAWCSSSRRSSSASTS